jgi:threonine synthase
MKFYSTNSPTEKVSLAEAVLRGLPPDNGLYMPEQLRRLPASFFTLLPQLSFADVGFAVSRALCGDVIPEPDLRRMVEETLSFDAPLQMLSENLHILELFHGPTLAFKDFGARFMARLMSHFVQQDPDERELIILVATSGDTGGAVASGFYQTPGTRVVILYPKGKVSFLQEKQLTTLGHNITALEVDGTFDQCQALVKQAFLDADLRQQLRLTSANSINIARLMPQVWYYFRAWQQLPADHGPVAFCVPSGNFGNLTGGLIATQLGLPIDHFIAATNANDVVPTYLQSGAYQPRPSVPTLSNAMDVGAPSNFVRMDQLHGRSWEAMQRHMSGFAYSDEETRRGIREVYHRYDYVIDPHGAVGYLATQEFLRAHPDYTTVLLETAHPAKFSEVVAEETGQPVDTPERLAVLRDRPKSSVPMDAAFEPFKAWLQTRFA